MGLTRAEIETNALKFIAEWKNETYEKGEAQSFWNDFFDIFGVKRKSRVEFERRTITYKDKDGFIDGFWKGKLILETKSRGKSLDKAFEQARDYFPGLSDEELPKYIVVSDFANFAVHDLSNGTCIKFGIEQLRENLSAFEFITDNVTFNYERGNAVDRKAAIALGKVYDFLKNSNYNEKHLSKYIVRLLFCFFADDALIFKPGIFREYIEHHTSPDGTDLAMHLGQLFEVMNTSDKDRSPYLGEALKQFPYIDGALFEETLSIPSFSAEMRTAILNCSSLDWSKISPSIFGSMFQSVMSAEERRNLGAHYTSENNILKVVEPLFLDELHDEYEQARDSIDKLAALRRRLPSLRFIDPACGCGNFLIIAYREIRILEMEILKQMAKKNPILNFQDNDRSIIDVNQFYGIEIEEFPAEIAKVALWLMDHQMNLRFSSQIGQAYARLPLKARPNIHVKNALDTDWTSILDPMEASYILGNPPYSGARKMNEGQKEDMKRVFGCIPSVGNLDYVTAWFRKALDYIKGTKVRVGFVSTNSITQGEQVSVLWGPLLRDGIKINFAHRTFKWSNEAKNNAAVYCVIIGFSKAPSKAPVVFDYADVNSPPKMIKVGRINPYLADADDVLIESRDKPLCDAPNIGIGNKPIDGGNYLFTQAEMEDFIRLEPNSRKYFRPWVGADELINGRSRYCLFLRDCDPSELSKMPEVRKRINAVEESRKKSESAPTLAIANEPRLFHVTNVPNSDYIVIPRVSSAKRPYVPISILSSDNLSSDATLIVESSDYFVFGILTSAMHMAWLRAVGGRLKEDYRYSRDIVYNNFPWPDASEKQKESIMRCTEDVLKIRGKFPSCSLGDLYNLDTMPVELFSAHKALDRAVDKAYGLTKGTEATRQSMLFKRYQELTR